MTENRDSELLKVMDFFHKIEHLKSTTRWNKTKTGRQESTAEHSWRLALMSFIIADELKLKLDILRVIKISLIHDMAEAITGDFDFSVVTSGKISKEQKAKLEFDAMEHLKSTLPEKIGLDVIGLWCEYEECKTEESRFVKALDKFESTIQQIDMDLVSNMNADIDGYKLIAVYPNIGLDYYPKLEPFWKIINTELKDKYKKENIPWKKDYDRIQ